MGEDSKIQWTDDTWNPWIGCTKISPYCTNCYAAVDTFARTARSKGRELWGPKADRHRTSEAYWRKPFAWDRAAEKEGVRRKVFCASLADIFEERPDLDPWRDDVHATIALTPNLDWQLLTKRPWYAKKYYAASDLYERVLASADRIRHGFDRRLSEIGVNNPANAVLNPNRWLGYSGEDAEGVADLLATPAYVRFLSIEPLLGPVDLSPLLPSPACPYCEHPETEHSLGHRTEGCQAIDTEEGVGVICGCRKLRGEKTHEKGDPYQRHGLDWVIVGGESGPNARPCDVSWVRSIVRQCREGAVPVFVKQLGARPSDDQWPSLPGTSWPHHTRFSGDKPCIANMNDHKGGTMTEWPEDLQGVREMPEAA